LAREEGQIERRDFEDIIEIEHQEMSGQIDKIQGILLNVGITMRSRTYPDYDIIAVARKYFELAKSYTLADN